MSTKKLAPHTNTLPILLDSIYCLHRIGDHSAAEVLASQSKSQLESSPVYKSIGQIIDLVGNYHQNTLSNADFAALTSVHPHVLASEIPLYAGWAHFLHGYFLKESKSLNNAVKCFAKGEHINELLETYYWMDKFHFLPVDEKIHSFLRLYPAKTVFSRLMGNAYFEKEVAPLTAIEKNQMQGFDSSTEEGFDCWLIKNKNIVPACYQDISLDDENFLDLYSGLINDRGEYVFLLIGELNCFSFLLASQLTGASATTVAEFLNRSEAEALALILSLKKMGIPIIEKNDIYFLEWTDKPVIIVPRSLKVVGLQEYVRKKKKTFTKAQLIELLQLTQFGAEALLRKWALAGHIRPVESADNMTVWKFV